jgi:hypothetical protein
MPSGEERTRTAINQVFRGVALDARQPDDRRTRCAGRNLARSDRVHPVKDLNMLVNSYVLWLMPLHVGDTLPFAQPPLSRPTDQKPM